MSFLKHPLVFILVPICLVASVVSFYRFVVLEAYVVEYEGACDPVSEECFVGCVDELCTDIYYYAWVQKNAKTAQAECGPDVLECIDTATCAGGEKECVVRYCNPETVSDAEECEDISSVDLLEEDGEQERIDTTTL